MPTHSHVHPIEGPEGERLALDVVRLGPSDAPKVLIVASGTHGVEGFCGSAIQLALLEQPADFMTASDVSVVLVHALNPYGFAWLRRTDADNVDLNRNFMDFSRPLPRNPRYAEIHEALLPQDWDGPRRASAEEFLSRYREQRGLLGLQEAISGGQYEFRDGLFYGGVFPSWSNRRWHEILQAQAAGAQLVAVIDVHSGLGASGACQLISGALPGTAEISAAQAWFGESLTFPGRDSHAPAATGYMGDTLKAALPGAVGALVVAEFGTVDFQTIFEALRADNWIHAHEPVGSRRWRDVKAQMREAFVLRQPAWQRAIVDQGLDLARRALRSLAESSKDDFRRAN